jgi:hypothetical protein
MKIAAAFRQFFFVVSSAHIYLEAFRFVHFFTRYRTCHFTLASALRVSE